MKALILAGGTGSRLRPITHSIAKQLVPVANKPVIEFGIEAIASTGITEFGIIVGDAHSEIEQHLGNGSRWGCNFVYIPQSAPLGLAHAVKTAQPYLGDDRFIMYLGDNLIKGGVKELVEQFQAEDHDASILLTRVPNPEQFGVAELAGDRVVRLQEKPKTPKSDLALVGVYLFTPLIFSAIDTLKPSFRGEYEITDAIQTLLDWNKDVRYQIVTGWWKDTGTVEAMLEANRLILDDLPPKCDGEVIHSKIEGSVSVGAATKIINSTVRGPSIIGAGCHIENAFIGPYSSIGDSVQILSSEVENSILMESSKLVRLDTRVSDSLVGRNVVVETRDQRPAATVLVLGDNSSVRLS